MVEEWREKVMGGQAVMSGVYRVTSLKRKRDNEIRDGIQGELIELRTSLIRTTH